MKRHLFTKFTEKWFRMRSSSFIEHFQVSTAAGKVKFWAKRLAQLLGSVDDPEDVDSGHAEVDPAEDAALLRLDVVQEEDQRVEEVVAALKKRTRTWRF